MLPLRISSQSIQSSYHHLLHYHQRRQRHYHFSVQTNLCKRRWNWRGRERRWWNGRNSCWKREKSFLPSHDILKKNKPRNLCVTYLKAPGSARTTKTKQEQQEQAHQQQQQQQQRQNNNDKTTTTKQQRQNNNNKTTTTKQQRQNNNNITTTKQQQQKNKTTTTIVLTWKVGQCWRMKRGSYSGECRSIWSHPQGDY